MPTSTSAVTILRDCAEVLAAAQGVLPLGTSTALGSVTTLVDGTRLAFSSADANLLDGRFLRIDSAVAGGPASGEWSRVTAGGLAAASGTLTLSPALSAAVQYGTLYSLWQVIHPAVALDLLNQFLRSHLRRTYYPISLIADADMELAGTANWTGTTATLSKNTAQANVYHGAQSLQMQGSGGPPQAESVAQAVIANDVIIASTICQAISGTCTLSVWDATNGVEITSGNHSQLTWQEINPLTAFVVPTTAKQITLRLKGSAASDNLIFDDAILWPSRRQRYVLPAWIEDPSHVIDVGYFTRGRFLQGSAAYVVQEPKFVAWRWEWDDPSEVEETGQNPFTIRLDAPIFRPLYLFALRPYDTLASDTATTSLDRRYCVLGTCWLIYDYLADAARRAGNPALEKQWLQARESVGRDAYLRSWQSRWGKRRLSLRAARTAYYQ